MQHVTSKAEVYGPFEMATLVGSDVLPFLSLPYASVEDSTAVITIGDNAGVALSQTAQPAGETAYCMIHGEIGVYGSVQGYQVLLKRQAVKANWGPMFMRFGSEDCYDQIVFKGRIFIGGKPGFPSNMVFQARQQLSVPVTVHLHTRGRR